MYVLANDGFIITSYFTNRISKQRKVTKNHMRPGGLPKKSLKYRLRNKPKTILNINGRLN